MKYFHHQFIKSHSRSWLGMRISIKANYKLMRLNCNTICGGIFIIRVISHHSALHQPELLWIDFKLASHKLKCCWHGTSSECAYIYVDVSRRHVRLYVWVKGNDLLIEYVVNSLSTWSSIVYDWPISSWVF